MTAVPGSEQWNQDKLYEVLRDLRDRVGKLERGTRTYAQLGTVTSFVGGSTTASVTFTGASNVACRYNQAYTPVVGHKVWVIFTPDGRFIACRDSVP